MHQLAPVVNAAVAADKPVVLVVDECHQLIQDKGFIARRLSSRFFGVFKTCFNRPDRYRKKFNRAWELKSHIYQLKLTWILLSATLRCALQF